MWKMMCSISRAAFFRRRGLFAVVLSLGIARAAPAAEAPPPGWAREPKALHTPLIHGVPRIQFAEPVFDFGEIASGGSFQHDFVFTNVGTATLEISQVRTSCGCTTAGEWDRRVEPGATGRIPIKFDTGSFSGPIQKTVTLVSNDPEQGRAVLQVKGKIFVAVEVSPKTVMFQYEHESAARETKEVRLVSHLTEPLAFSEVRSENPSFHAVLEAVRPGAEFVLRITTVPPVGTGTVAGPVVLTPSDTNVPPIRVQVYAMERQPLLISPASLLLPAGPVRAGMRPTVTIRSNTTNQLALTEARINVPGAEVELKELQPGRLFTLTPILPEGFEMPVGQRVEITVKSNHRRHPEIRVPVLQSRQAARLSSSLSPVRTNTVLRALPTTPPPVPAPTRGGQ
jgi:hypothetical protein